MPKEFNVNKEDKKSLSLGNVDEEKILKQVKNNFDDSWNYYEPTRETWDEKEALLICKLKDSISTDSATESGVFDPRLATITFERTARVMAQQAKGKAYATSVNDLGKSKLMNLLRDYHYRSANYWRPMLIKERLMDLYSLIYGTMPALVAWVVREDHIGPEMIPWQIRMWQPQPGVTSMDESDWTQLGSMKGVDWLKKQPAGKDGTGWRNVDKLLKAMKGGTDETSGDVKPSEQRTYVEEEYFQVGEMGSTNAPKVELRTEYRKDRWITYAPKYDLILRIQKNPYGEPENDHYGYIPVITKDAFPLMDSIFGLGEFERGKTLQYALNSLWNLYLTGVKYSIFPPVHINPKNVVRTSIKWGAGEKWLMNQPNVDVQMMQMNPQGMQTFQSTYQYLLSAIMNQAGTTDVSSPTSSENTMGRTPQAVRYTANRESARDEWDRVMMEDTIKSRENMWIDMIVKKMEKPVTMRIFGPEMETIARDYPDVMDFFDMGNKYGSVTIPKERIKAKYDFEIDTGSTMKPNLEGEAQAMDELIQLVIKAPQAIQAMQMQGKTIDFAELMKRSLINKGIKDYDKIVIDIQGQGPTGVQAGGQYMPSAGDMDSMVSQLEGAAQTMGGMGAIPPTPQAQPAPAQAQPGQVQPPQMNYGQ